MSRHIPSQIVKHLISVGFWCPISCLESLEKKKNLGNTTGSCIISIDFGGRVEAESANLSVFLETSNLFKKYLTYKLNSLS